MKKLALQTKLFILASVLIAFTLVIGGVGLWSSKSISNSYAKINEVSFPNTKDILEMNLLYRLARLELFNIILPDVSEEEQQKSLKKINESWENFYGMLDKYKAKGFQPGEEEFFNAFRAKADVVKADFDKVLELLKKNMKADSDERKQIVSIMKNEMRPHGLDYRAAVDKLKEYQNNAALAASNEAKATEGFANKFITTALFSALIVGFLFAYILSKNLVKTFGELGKALYSSSQELDQASTNIASAAEELSQATTEQAASLQETSASTEQMSSMVTKNSDNAKNAAGISTQSQLSAEKGKQVVEQMIRSMDDINQSNNNIMDQINHSNSEIESIVRVIQEIGAKTKVINEIVFQTKLLSFNASVEAARAGENGKGFAVVAEEVGSLAQMSGNAAKEISDLLDGSIQRVESIVNDTKSKVSILIEDGRSKVEVGTDIAKQCGDVLNEIVSNVAQVTQMAGEISVASQEQAAGVNEITKAMGQLDQATQQNAATSEQVANSAENLSTQASYLKHTVDQLMATIEGGEPKSTTTRFKSVEPTPAVVPQKAKASEKNVISFSKAKKESGKQTEAKKTVHSADTVKVTADGTTPSSGHPGFKDI